MKSRWVWTALVGLVGLAVYVGKVRATPATPPPGFTGTTIAMATLDELNSHTHTVPADWQFLLKTKGLTDLYVQENTWQPGATTGWHTHPGPSLVIIKEGTVAVYDESCTRHEYSGPSSFVDVGGGVVHLVRNESSTTVAHGYAVQFVPNRAIRRIDEPNPGCSVQ
jgi:quercetin dioxygenase-like cupin family protein